MSKKTESNVAYEAKQAEYEFGGPIGVSALMIWSHYIVFYFWYVILLLFI